MNDQRESNYRDRSRDEGNRMNTFWSRHLKEGHEESTFQKSFGFIEKVPWEKISIWTLFLLLLWILRDFFTLIVLTFVFSYIINFIVAHLSERWFINRRILTVLVYIVFLGLILGPGQWFVERIVEQGRPIAQNAGAFIQDLVEEEGQETKKEKTKSDEKTGNGESDQGDNDQEKQDRKPSKQNEKTDSSGAPDQQDPKSPESVPGEPDPPEGASASQPDGTDTDRKEIREDGKLEEEEVVPPGYQSMRHEIRELETRLDSYGEQLKKVMELEDQQRSPLINEWIQLLQVRQKIFRRELENLRKRDQLGGKPQPSHGSEQPPQPEVTDIEDVPPHVRNIVDNILLESLGEEWFSGFKEYELYRQVVLEANTLWKEGVPLITRWSNYIFINALSFSFTILLALMFSFFIVFDIPTLKRRLSELEDSRLRDFYREIAPSLANFSSVMGRSIQAQAMIAIVNTILTGLGIYLMDLPNPALLTGIVFVCSFIPVLGVIISTIPIGIVALAKGGFVLLLVVIGLIILIHGIETYLLNPNIYGAHLRMHPLMVLIVLLVSEHFFGIWGLILGVPVAVYLLEVVIQQTTPEELFYKE